MPAPREAALREAAPPHTLPPPPALAIDPPAKEPEETPPVRPFTRWYSDTKGPLSRVDDARDHKLDVVKQLFAAAGVAFPPAQVLLRGFKREKRLELWAASRVTDRLEHVTTYTMCSASGQLGPKRKRGDFQVPEGFYTLTDYSPSTPFHLAMLVSYPNLSDRILGDKRDPGAEIMIHGRCASVGCLAMGDERIEELWVATTALRFAGGVVHVHLFPARDIPALIAEGESAEHRAFWENLDEGLRAFERERRIPSVRIDADGRYRFR